MNLFKYWFLLQVWCHLAPLAIASAPDPDPDASPAPLPVPGPEQMEVMMVSGPPVFFQWMGSIGGTIGTIMFVADTIRSMFFTNPPDPAPPPKTEQTASFWRIFEDQLRSQFGWEARVAPDKKGDPSWQVAIQVGLDGTGLEGAGGDFPQICLWNAHGQLIGYNDQSIRFAKPDGDHPENEIFNSEGTREEGIPLIRSGGVKTVGIWPAPGLEDRQDQQAVYVTMIKRHFDAICVSEVFIQSSDSSKWCFDGSWGRASNRSWYYSFIIDPGRLDGGECFWLDHRGDLTHKKDLAEEYIGAQVKDLGKEPKKQHGQDWLWAGNVQPEAGIPEGNDLTDGMRENQVHQYKVPLGVKFHAPQFNLVNYGPDFDNLTLSDIVDNPARINWITEPTRKNVRGGNLILPILHPRASLSDKTPEVLWEDKYKQKIPVDCMTDWYYDENDKLVEPSRGDRCAYLWKFGHIGKFGMSTCDGKKTDERMFARSTDDHGNKNAPLPLHKRYERTLVNDKTPRRGGNGARELCDSPQSVGPSYANHGERWFCRMSDKTMWPFCDDAAGVLHDCFDAEAEILVEKDKPLGKRAQHWDVIEDWHSGQRSRRAA